MKNRFVVLIAAAMLGLGTSAVFAAGEHAQHQPAANATAAVLTAGEVRKIDLAQGKITLKHEAISNIDMPGMTMVFRAADAGLLKTLKVGDKVRFHAESDGGGILVTHILAEN